MRHDEEAGTAADTGLLQLPAEVLGSSDQRILCWDDLRRWNRLGQSLDCPLDGRLHPAHDAAMRSQHISRVISASPEAVHEYASKVENLPEWAAGLAQSELIKDGDTLFVESPMGRVEVRLVERNRYGVLDHDVTLPSGTVVTNPVRVLSHPDGAEVVFTVRQIELATKNSRETSTWLKLI